MFFKIGVQKQEPRKWYQMLKINKFELLTFRKIITDTGIKFLWSMDAL